MKRLLNFIIGKLFKIPRANLDNIYPPITCEITPIDVETIRAEVMIPKYIPEEVYKKELIHKLGEALTDYIKFETVEDPILDNRYRCRGTIKIVKE